MLSSDDSYRITWFVPEPSNRAAADSFLNSFAAEPAAASTILGAMLTAEGSWRGISNEGALPSRCNACWTHEKLTATAGTKIGSSG